jgi:hypothetical protein
MFRTIEYKMNKLAEEDESTFSGIIMVCVFLVVVILVALS